MIFKIAWKNIWRKKSRSLIVILSVALGVFVGLFFSAFNWGSMNQKMNDLVNRELGHLQIHQNKFIEEFEYKYSIPNDSIVDVVLNQNPNVKAYAKRTVVVGRISSIRTQAPVMLRGVDTTMENNVGGLTSYIVEGKFKGGKRSPGIMIGKALAEELKVKVGNTISFHGGIWDQNIAFSGKVRAIYESPNKMKDKSLVYVHQEDLERFAPGVKKHEYAILLNDYDSIPSTQANIQASLPDLEVLNWGEIMPEIKNAIEMSDVIMFIFMMIIWFALALGIVNTMLMSILERTQELGMLMAIGMSRFKIVVMIFFETFVLTLVGVPIGILLTVLSVNYLGEVGIDLANFNSVMEEFGYESVIYPAMKSSFYAQVVFQVVLVSFISTIFPSMRALRLRPVEAIRKI